MPHLEEQFPLINPLVLLRPDALDPPEREEEENNRVENRSDDETPRPGTLADGIDRVTLSANARVIAPVQPLEETVPVPTERNPSAEGETATDDEIIGTGLQDFVNGIEANRFSDQATNRIERNPADPPDTPILAPVTLPAPSAEPVTRPASRTGNRVATEPVTNVDRGENAAPRDDNRFVPTSTAPRNPLSTTPDNRVAVESAEEVPEESTLRLQGNIPEPLERRVNILTPANIGEDPPGPNIEEARNFGQGRTLTLDPDTVADERNVISLNTVDEVLEEAGAIPGPETDENAPPELLIAPAVQPAFVTEPDSFESIEPEPNLSIEDDAPEPLLSEPRDFNPQRDPADIPGPAGANVAVSSSTDTRQVFEEDLETQALQAPAFPELDPDEPFAPNLQPEAREENIPAVAQAPLNAPPPEDETIAPLPPSLPNSVVIRNENRQALRPDNLGTEPSLRSNRAIRNFLEEFNSRIEIPEAVTESEGGPIAEVQNNAPPPPAVFENLEAIQAELLNDLREQEGREGVTRPEEERSAPPEPRTPETLLTERGQNIDQFI